MTGAEHLGIVKELKRFLTDRYMPTIAKETGTVIAETIAPIQAKTVALEREVADVRAQLAALQREIARLRDREGVTA